MVLFSKYSVKDDLEELLDDSLVSELLDDTDVFTFFVLSRIIRD